MGKETKIRVMCGLIGTGALVIMAALSFSGCGAVVTQAKYQRDMKRTNQEAAMEIRSIAKQCQSEYQAKYNEGYQNGRGQGHSEGINATAEAFARSTGTALVELLVTSRRINGIEALSNRELKDISNAALALMKKSTGVAAGKKHGHKK